MKEKVLKLIDAKRAEEKRLNEALINSDIKEERAELGKTLLSVKNELEELERILYEMDEPKKSDKKDDQVIVEVDDDIAGRSGFNMVATTRSNGVVNDSRGKSEAVEKRANEFKKTNRMSINNEEARSVLVSSGQIATPTKVDGIRDMFNTVSSIVDLVKVVDASGMGAYKVAYQISDMIADEQNPEGEAYNSSDPTFGYVEIKPTTYAVISSISKQVRKQTPLQYEAKVRDSALYALRTKAAALITNAILSSSLTQSLAINTGYSDQVLRKIAFNYGGDVSIIGEAVLFLNKADLISLGDLRATNGVAIYEITPDTANPNTGIIKDGGLSVKYCLNNNLSVGTMLYGQPICCELALFSNYDVSVSEDYMFNTGMLAIRGDVELGADVTKNNGFIKVTITPPAYYTLTYDANGGSGTMAEDISDANGHVEIAENTFTKEGFTFSAWNTAAEGTGTSYDPGDIIDINSNTTLYAQWTS